MEKLSVIIPARNEPFLNKTVDGLFENAKEEIEVIVMLDGYWPDPPLKAHDNLVIVHMGTVQGMRENINAAAKIATGKYIMKTDAHCLFAKGFDKVLKADCEPDWLSVPRRYSLDGKNWKKRRKPIDYLYLTYPYGIDKLYGAGFHGKKWHGEHGLTGGYYYKEKQRKDILIDDIIAFQGSCWFMHRELFFKIECLDAANYNFHQEALELGMKVWLSGGRVIRNKKTWYAHLHKGKQYGRGFWLSKRGMVKSEIFSADIWMNNKWPGQIHDIKWLIDKFWPLEGWPEDWWDPKYGEAWVHPGLKKKQRGEQK